MPPRSLRYNERAGRYQDAAGRFVALKTVRADLNAAIVQAGAEMQDLARAFQRRELSLKGFELAMRERIKNVEIWAAQSSVGGAAQMRPADYGRAGQQIRFSYGKLAEWMREVARGKVVGRDAEGREIRVFAPVDGRFVQRAALYAEHARVSASAAVRGELRRRGFDLVRSIRRSAESCQDDDAKDTAGCVEQEAKGWQSFDAYVPLGSRTCRVRDLCDEQYKNSRTGEIAA